MGERSAIEWTDATWNPVTGCSKVSPGCAHCYAETLALTRLAGRPGYGGKPWVPENAADNVVLRPERLRLPLTWREPRRIFVNSMSDLFHELVPIEYVARVFDVMASATLVCEHRRWDDHDAECWTGPRHTFQVLTKRPERMRHVIEELPHHVAERWRGDSTIAIAMEVGDWPLPNVWLGTSVENQTWADRRIPELLATPAAVRFLSCEPLLGPLDLGVGLRVSWQCSGCRRYYSGRHRETCPDCGAVGYWTGSHAFNRPDGQTGPGIDWVIVGGESGPEHRPVDPAWVRSVRDQCQATGVPFLFKQWGGRTSKSGGRELDGRTWDGFPAVPA